MNPPARLLLNLTNNAARMTAALPPGLDARLLKAIQIRGEFPSSLNLLTKLQSALKENPTTLDLSRMICVDHVLALRTIAIANYEYYRGGRNALTVTDALESLTVPKLQDVIINLAEAKNFNAIYLSRSASLTMMQQAILASLLARGIIRCARRRSILEEQAYVLAVLSNLAPLLLAFYRPDLYSGLCLDAMDDYALFGRILRTILNQSGAEFGAAAARTLSLPPLYVELCTALTAENLPRSPNLSPDHADVIQAVAMANELAHEICYGGGVQGVQSLLARLETNPLVDLDQLEDLIGIAPDIYLEHCRTLGIKPVRLPEYLLWFAPVSIGSRPVRWRLELPGINERINPFLYELRSCFKSTRCPTVEAFNLPQAVYCTLSALLKGLNFDRAILFRVDEEKRLLLPLLCRGIKLFRPEKLRRFLEDPDAEIMPDVCAYFQKQAVFRGDPVFNDGWPFTAFPIICDQQVLGVFYADKIRRPDSNALDAQELISCVALAEEWHDIPEDMH